MVLHVKHLNLKKCVLSQKYDIILIWFYCLDMICLKVNVSLYILPLICFTRMDFSGQYRSLRSETRGLSSFQTKHINDRMFIKNLSKQCQYNVTLLHISLVLVFSQQYFSYIVAASFIGGENRTKLPTYRKSVTNFYHIKVYRVHLAWTRFVPTHYILHLRWYVCITHDAW